MQKLPLTLFVALLVLGAVSVPAQALGLPLPPVPLVAPDEEVDDEPAEGEEGEDSGECTIEDEEDVQLCAEIAAEEREEAAAEECVLEDATARVKANPGERSVALIVRYQADAPASVEIDARLRGNGGGVYLGADQARFRRAGTFRDTFLLGERRMDRVLAAREFELELQAVKTPRYCRIELNGALHRAKRSRRAGAPGRSGDPAPTRGR
jgi:hypothetical protein